MSRGDVHYFCEITFKVEIQPSPGKHWKVETIMSLADRFGYTGSPSTFTETDWRYLPKESECTIETPSGSTTIRPILLDYRMGSFGQLLEDD